MKWHVVIVFLYVYIPKIGETISHSKQQAGVDVNATRLEAGQVRIGLTRETVHLGAPVHLNW